MFMTDNRQIGALDRTGIHWCHNADDEAWAAEVGDRVVNYWLENILGFWDALTELMYLDDMIRNHDILIGDDGEPYIPMDPADWPDDDTGVPWPD